MSAPRSKSEARLESDARFLVRLSLGFIALTMVLAATMMPVFVQAIAERDWLRPPVVLVPMDLLILLPMGIVAIRAARARRFLLTVWLIAIGFWLSSLVNTIVNPSMSMITLLASLIPGIVAMHYAPRRVHRQIILVTVLVATTVAVLGGLDYRIMPRRWEPTGFDFVYPVVFLASMLLLVVWHSAERLRESISELRASEESLETKVSERTRDLETARDAAEVANRTKSAFLANMSHELRTPMNAILGYSEMLVEEAEDEGDEETAADLNKIHGAGTHLLSLINDVLDLSKIEAGKMDLFLETFEVPGLISEIADTATPLVEKNGNQLVLEVDAALGEMRADVTKVRQTIFNLLSNASKFTHEGEIRVVAALDAIGGEGALRVAVSDTGIGIAPDKLDRVFEEFSQAEESTARNYGGTGLGLPLSRRFCEMMGGSLGVESTPGEGSTFTALLPLDVRSPEEAESVAADEAAPPALPEREQDQDRDRIVLVVDDDPDALDILGRTLEGAGLHVVTANRGSDALRLARSLAPAAITLDVEMPDMDGWEVLDELKSDPETRHIPVIMVTMTDDREAGYALGATEFLTKPVQREQLVGLLDRYVASGSAQRALVVDDDPAVRERLRSALDAEGWTVDEAGNGREALERVGELRPTLILLDLMMPVMDGFEFVLEMRALDPSWQIPIVVVTAKDLSHEDRARLTNRVAGVIEKRGLGRETLLAQLQEQLSAMAT